MWVVTDPAGVMLPWLAGSCNGRVLVI